MPEDQIPAGDRLVKSDELSGQALAWAACSLWGVPAIIVSGGVHVEVELGRWDAFSPEAMLRSVIAGHIGSCLVPEELCRE